LEALRLAGAFFFAAVFFVVFFAAFFGALRLAFDFRLVAIAIVNFY
jgi:hypothetical protein